MSAKNDAFLIGNGPRRVIALHGWFGSARAWGPMLSSLDTDSFSYAFMDCRGYGARKGSGGPYTMAQISADLRDLADELGWQQFSLLGHSMGGLAIQQVLADQPGRVQAMVGITPVPASGVPFDDSGWALFSSAATEASARRIIIDMTTGKRLSGRWLDGMVAASLAHADAEAVAGYLPAWSKTDITARITGKTVPVLVLAGEHDPAISAAVCEATWLQHYPNARLQVIGNAGHYPMEEAPVALVSAFEAFLRTAPG